MEVRILLRSEEYIDRKIFESEQILRLLSLLDEEEVRIFSKITRLYKSNEEKDFDSVSLKLLELKKSSREE